MHARGMNKVHEPMLVSCWSPTVQHSVEFVNPSALSATARFDNFTDQNPFTLKNLESYRMQF
ncbi:hypothetical protein AURDEDRAFT_176530 [Auricularia subglabra TFB-10046 SS5]|uniref:Uncharacterized protein n=1 Tax=Auricularia subglabra (strain TFB-10046 / SS5) TaxID=717982 RepID=J0WPQ2_AURST|nr:hypothetical protein AURDEDRAFT_176530 [Auricularia subglabra TFB-10046 SS5]